MLSGNVGLNSPQFIADFLVTHIKPSFEIVKQKVGNLTLQARIVHLFPENEIPDLLTYTKNTQLMIIDGLKVSLPSWFDSNEYISKLQKQLKFFLDQNKDLSVVVDELQTQPDFDNPNSSKIFRDAIILLGDKMNDWYTRYESYCAK